MTEGTGDLGQIGDAVDDSLGYEFAEFAEGEEGDEFGDFDDGFQQPEQDQEHITGSGVEKPPDTNPTEAAKPSLVSRKLSS